MVQTGGQRSQRGEKICVIETTKSIVDVSADGSGYLRPLARVGERVRTGRPLAALTATPDEDLSSVHAPDPDRAEPARRRWTRKAAIVAKRLGVDIEGLAAAQPDRVVSELDVRSAVRQTEGDFRDLVDDVHPANRTQRVVLLGGGAGGGVIVLDALSRIPGQRAVGILDNNPRTHGRTIMGTPVLGGSELAEQLWNDGACDGFVNAFIDPIEDRRRNFERLTEQAIPFINVIDPSAAILANVQLGQGNVIAGNCYIGPCSTIGDNNFLTSHASLDHHIRIGSHCTFGPRNTMSGGGRGGRRSKDRRRRVFRVLRCHRRPIHTCVRRMYNRRRTRGLDRQIDRLAHGPPQGMTL